MELLIIIVQEVDYGRLSREFIKLEYIRQSCTERVEEKLVSEFNGQMFVDVVKGVKIGGATVFTADVDKIMKF